MLAKALIVLALTIPLSGCLFFYVPGSAIDAIAGRPQICVTDTVKVGDHLTTVSKSGELVETNLVITKIHGPSPYYCRKHPPEKQIGADVMKKDSV